MEFHKAAAANMIAQNIESIMWNKICTISSAYDTVKCIFYIYMYVLSKITQGYGQILIKLSGNVYNGPRNWFFSEQ